MAVGDRELAITLRAVIDPLVAGLRDAGNRVKEFAVQTEESFAQVEQSGERISRLWKAMFEAFIGFELLEGLKKIAEQANEAGDALEIAARTAENLGKAFNVSDVERYLEQLAKSAQGGGYSIQQMRDAIQQFTAAGANAAQSERLLNDAIALAAGRHMDLGEAVRMVMYAETGHIEMLSRYGINVKDASGKLVDFTTAMERLEQTFHGDAEERAKGLEGAFGRLGAAVRLLTENIGAGLIPLFEGFANAAARLADWFAGLPKWVTDAAAGIAFFSITLGGLALLMPGIVKLGAIMVDGVGLLRATVGTITGLFSTFGGILGSVVVGGIRGVVAALDVMRAALFSTAVAEATAEAPIALLLAGFAVLGVAIYEIQKHWDELAKVVESAVNFMSRAWSEFVTNFLHNGAVLNLFIQGLMRLLSGDIAGGSGDMMAAMRASMPKTSEAIYNGIKLGIDSGVAYLKKAWNDAIGWFKAAFGPSPGVTKTDFSGLGGPGKSGDAQKAINDHITAAKGAIQAALDAAAAGVQAATDRLDVAKANLEAFKATLDNGKPSTQAQALEEQRLLRAEAAAEVDQRSALAAKMQAEFQAQMHLLELARALPAADKERVKHQTELAAEARKHGEEILKIQAEYVKLGGIIAQIPAQIRKAWEELRAQQRAAAAEQLQGGLRTDQSAVQDQLEELRVKEQSGRISGSLSKTDEAQIAQARAQLQLQLADLGVAAAHARLALDDFYKADPKTVASDQNTLTTAIATQKKAQDDLTLSTQTLEQAQREAAQSFGTTIKKRLLDQIPGVSVGATGNVAFNFATFLADAAQKSKAFGDVMQFVGEVVNIVAQIIDAFRPIIDIFLKALAMVVNGFVELWNVIARILRIFGIHVELLQKINTNFGQLNQTVAPLIRVVHDIPTLNELATGNIAKLVANDYSASAQWNQPITDGLKDPGLGGGLLGALGQILEAIVALKIAMSVFGGGGGILGHLLGNSGNSIIKSGENWLGKVLGLGGNGGMTVDQAETIDQGLGGGTGLASPGPEVASDARASGGLFHGGLSNFFNGQAGSLGTILESVGIGAGLGALQGGTHSIWGAVGGLVGSFIPVPGAGAILGAIGSLFGNKGPNAHDNPDQFNSSDLGSMVMDFQAYNGQQGTFGNEHIGQDATITQATSGKGIVEYLKEKVAGMSQNAIQSMFGSDTSSIMNLLQHWDPSVQFTQGKNGSYNIGGQSMYWSDIASTGWKAWQDFQQAMSGATQGLQQMGQTLSSQAQSITQSVSASGNQLASSAQQSASAATQLQKAAIAGASAVLTGTPGRILDAGIAMTNHFHGDIHGYDDVEQIGQDLAVSGQRAVRMRAYQLDRIQSQ